MRKIVIDSGTSNSTVYVGPKVRDALPSSSGKRIILTDKNVYSLYGHEFPEGKVIVVRPGESSKTLTVAGDVMREMMEAGIDRSGSILGIGGGVVCDLTGFIGSVYMRGIPFGFISTTLLSQTDASIGGKNGVNLDDKKNIIGTFNNPGFVLCDTSMLESLPEVEFRSGLGEVIKYAIIGSRQLFDMLRDERRRVGERDQELLMEVVSLAIEIKKKVVEADFRESGIRKILNLGHTLGHALELKGGYRHGVAVATGISFAAYLSTALGITPAARRNEIDELLAAYGLSPCISRVESDSLQLIGSDKKRRGDHIDFVVIEDVARVSVRALPLEQVLDLAGKWRPEL